MFRIVAALALACVLSACQTIDTRIAEVSDRLAARCVELQSAVTVVDILAPESVRAAVSEGRIIFDRFCAEPPRTAAELAIAIGETLQAMQITDRRDAMLFNILKPIVAVLLSAAFTRIVTLGYLTPQDAGAIQKALMDALALGVPAATAWYLAKGATPTALIKTVDALPQVEGVAVKPDIANTISSETVTVIESLPAAIADAAR